MSEKMHETFDADLAGELHRLTEQEKFARHIADFMAHGQHLGERREEPIYDVDLSLVGARWALIWQDKYLNLVKSQVDEISSSINRTSDLSGTLLDWAINWQKEYQALLQAIAGSTKPKPNMQRTLIEAGETQLGPEVRRRLIETAKIDSCNLMESLTLNSTGAPDETVEGIANTAFCFLFEGKCVEYAQLMGYELG